MSKILMWIVWNIPLGRLAPIVLGWALGVKGERIDDKEDTNECERNLRGLRKSVFSRKVCIPMPGVQKEKAEQWWKEKCEEEKK